MSAEEVAGMICPEEVEDTQKHLKKILQVGATGRLYL
nr:MAG TPA: hypothetical protein [Caudoviricetes sp.]